MPGPLEQMIRDAYAAFAGGDLEGYLRACTEDFAFHVPGHCALSGAYFGRAGLYQLATRAMELSGGTFEEEVDDVLAGERHAVVLARHRFIRDTEAQDYRTAHVYEIRDGKLAVCYEHPRDPEAFYHAWRDAEEFPQIQSA